MSIKLIRSLKRALKTPRNLKLFSTLFLLAGFCAYTPLSFAKPERFGEQLCSNDQFECVEIQEGQTWSSLWEDKDYQYQLKELNRTNLKLRTGMKIAIPRDKDFFSKPQNSPLPIKIDSFGEKQIQVNLSKLVWGAYDEEGNLRRWGAASGGKDWCPDVQATCQTIVGEFSILRKGGALCKSGKFPIGKGGAPMPYCMFFKGGYALHGSYEVPGYNASHGCVRLFPEDAKWLNEEFTQQNSLEDPAPQIKVIIEPY